MTTRRSFFSTLATAVAGFTILPPATTYARIWKATRQPEWKDCILHLRESSVPNPNFLTAPMEMDFIWNPRAMHGIWNFHLDNHPIRFALDQGNVFRRVETP